MDSDLERAQTSEHCYHVMYFYRLDFMCGVLGFTYHHDHNNHGDLPGVLYLHHLSYTEGMAEVVEGIISVVFLHAQKKPVIGSSVSDHNFRKFCIR